jgi:hypothetical protein
MPKCGNKVAVVEVAQPALTRPESARLAELENRIDKGEKTFVEVGLALSEIRAQRLYRATHPTFEDYCRAKWNFTRQYGNQVIDSAATVKSLPEGLETIVSNFGQARALAKVPEEKRVAVLKAAQKIAAARKLTAKDIQHAYAPERGTEPRESRNFGTARQSQKAATQWWYASATPERRGEFLLHLLTTAKKVSVPDTAQFKKIFENFLARNAR